MATPASTRCQSSHKHAIETLSSAAFTAATLFAATPSVAQAAEAFTSTASAVDASSLQLALGGGVAIAGLGAVLVATDPQKR